MFRSSKKYVLYLIFSDDYNSSISAIEHRQNFIGGNLKAIEEFFTCGTFHKNSILAPWISTEEATCLWFTVSDVGYKLFHFLMWCLVFFDAALRVIGFRKVIERFPEHLLSLFFVFFSKLHLVDNRAILRL